jgi:preprotein translocase subunit SecE
LIGFYLLAGQATLIRAVGINRWIAVSIAFAWTSYSDKAVVGFARESVKETKK